MCWLKKLPFPKVERDFHQDVFVEKMLTNLPIKDCDVKIHADLKLKYEITKNFEAFNGPA
jgi:hypothetical protein